MKRTIVWVLAVLMAFPLCGCGIGERIREKAGEDIAEDIIEDYTSADVEISGDEVTIEDEEGNSYSYGGTDWPTSNLAGCIPLFTGGTITAVMDSEESVFISLEGVTQEDYEAYLSTIKGDYAVNAFEANSEGYSSYGASNDDGISVSLIYSEEELAITVYKEAQ